MKRNVSLEEIPDGHLYGYHDMVKADCYGCSASGSTRLSQESIMISSVPGIIF